MVKHGETPTRFSRRFLTFESAGEPCMGQGQAMLPQFLRIQLCGELEGGRCPAKPWSPGHHGHHGHQGSWTEAVSPKVPRSPSVSFSSYELYLPSADF